MTTTITNALKAKGMLDSGDYYDNPTCAEKAYKDQLEDELAKARELKALREEAEKAVEQKAEVPEVEQCEISVHPSQMDKRTKEYKEWKAQQEASNN